MEKASDPLDRRATLLYLTAHGTQAVETARAHRRRMLDAILVDWTAEERGQFLRALQRFNDTMDLWIARDAVPH